MSTVLSRKDLPGRLRRGFLPATTDLTVAVSVGRFFPITVPLAVARMGACLLLAMVTDLVWKYSHDSWTDPRRRERKAQTAESSGALNFES